MYEMYEMYICKIFHRDVKMQKMLCDCKVIDFGLEMLPSAEIAVTVLVGNVTGLACPFSKA